MVEPSSAAAMARLVGGDPSLDFVNSVGGRVEHLGDPGSDVLADKLTRYADLVAWSRHAGLVDDAQARSLARHAARHPREAAAVFGRAIALREALHRTLTSLLAGRRPSAADIDRLSAEIAVARSSERLRAGRGGLLWEWALPGKRLDSPLWPVCRAAAALLTSDLSRLRRCAGDRCGWLFLDRSRNHSRQWCTMEDCGNLSKVRRFRERTARLARDRKGDASHQSRVEAGALRRV
jgi:predicted RNA-binding Zn ribbon-like protein